MTQSLKSVTGIPALAHSVFQLQLLLRGPPEARAAGRLLTFPTRKTLALLAYLAAAEGAQPRDHLATLLWPETSPQRSYASLRNTLSHLQRTLRQAGGSASSGFLAVTHTTLGLNPEAGIELDLQTEGRAYALARAERSSRRAPPAGSSGRSLLQAATSRNRGIFSPAFRWGMLPASMTG